MNVIFILCIEMCQHLEGEHQNFPNNQCMHNTKSFLGKRPIQNKRKANEF